MQRHGWNLLFHACVIEQLRNVHLAADRARSKDPEGYERNANVRLFNALTHLMLEVIPSDPGSDVYRQGNTLGAAFRHWRRAKIGRRFRLFFRYDSRARIIVFGWVNDAQTLRKAGSKSDPYRVFRQMLNAGNPPDEWQQLVDASRADWKRP